MKTRLILSSLTVLSYCVATSLLDFFYAPLTGTANAQTVNDSVVDYTFAKFIRDGYMGNLLFLLLIISFIVVWTVFKKQK